MLQYIPTRRDDMAGLSWIWLDLPNGDRVMLMDQEHGVALAESTVCALAANVLERPSKAS